MARLPIGRLTFRVTHEPNFAGYARRVLSGVTRIMQRSERRVFEEAKAATPVDTGHMQANLLTTSDLADVTTSYHVFWRAQEFVGEVNPRGRLITEFYPAILIFGGANRPARYPTLLTAQLEAERPRLLKELRDHFQQAAR